MKKLVLCSALFQEYLKGRWTVRDWPNTDFNNFACKKLLTISFLKSLWNVLSLISSFTLFKPLSRQIKGMLFS